MNSKILPSLFKFQGSNLNFRVSTFKFQISNFEFPISNFKFQVSSFIILLWLASCKPSTTPEVIAVTIKYTCPMHPSVIQDGPGKCPSCGMDLVPQTNANSSRVVGLDP